MGIHTGEGTLGGDDYLGLDVNRAARIGAAGHGGQLLLSGPATALIEHSLPEGVELRDMGAHRLKDLAHPERIYQVVVAGLPSEFPALRSMDARPNNLPLQLTSMVGRIDEIGATIDMLERHRLVTLTGPGGTGKTRLAVEVAGRLLHRFDDGVYMVELAAVSDPAQVTSAIAQTLGIHRGPGTFHHRRPDRLARRQAGIARARQLRATGCSWHPLLSGCSALCQGSSFS